MTAIFGNKRIKIGEQPTQFQIDLPLSIDIFETILISVDERIIEMMKMVTRNSYNFFTVATRSFWQARVKQGTIHTYEDIAQIPKKLPDLKKLSLVHVREPLKSWRVVTQLTQLVSLQVHCQIDFNPPGTDWRKNMNYDYLKRCDGSIPYKLQGPQKLQETYDTVQQIATLTNLKELEIHPGPLFFDNISHFAKLTNLERLYAASPFYQWDQQNYQIHRELIKLSNLRELNLGVYHQQMPDTVVFSFLRSFQDLRKLKLSFWQPNSQFLGLGQLTKLQKLSLQVSDSTISIFLQIKLLTKLTTLHLHPHLTNFRQIPFESVMDCIPHLQQLQEFYIKAFFDEESLLAQSLFKLPNFQKFIAIATYEADSSQPEGYRSKPTKGNYGDDFWDKSNLS